MKKFVTLASLIIALGLAASTPAKAEVKIGFVDMNKVFSSYYKTKDAESRINDARTAAKQELDDRMATYQKNLDDINKFNEALAKPELSKEAKDKKEKDRDEKIAETKSLEREITEFRTTRESQLKDQAVRMRTGIVEEITKVIQEKVKSDQYDLVLDKSGNSFNGVPVILYSKDSNDFSADIITALNKNKPKESATTPATLPEASPLASPSASPKSEKSSKKK